MVGLFSGDLAAYIITNTGAAPTVRVTKGSTLMIYAKKLKMKPGCRYSQSLLEIDEIYLEGDGLSNFYKKALIHEFLKINPNSIQVYIWPFPNVIPATSMYGEKYVRSSPDQYRHDDLLDLPRE